MRAAKGTAIMSRNPNRGRVYRRCACRDATGKQLGAHCPELTNRRHGRWAFAVDLPTVDQQRRTMRRCGFLTQAHARAALHRVLACEQAGIHSDDRQTVAEYLNDWLEYKQRTLKPTTMARYRDYVHKDLSPALGALRLEQLTHHHVSSFVSIQLAAGRGRVTLHRCVATLSSALTDAVRNHRLIHNPARYANIPRPRRSPRVCWSPAQAVAFLHYCAQIHDPLAELCELILCTGMRKGEALALHWADVDLDAQVLLVRYTLSNINNTTPVFTTPKTKSSHTWIGLSSRAVRALHRQAERQRVLRLATGPAYRDQDGVHPTRRTTPSTRVRAAPPPPTDR
jgi:integrase